MFRMRIIVLLLLASGIPAEAQPRVGGLLTCAPSTISGPYGHALSGFLVDSQRITPFADYGTLVADGNGSFSGTSTASTGGIIATRNISGKYSINTNCTGTATFGDSLGNVLTLAFTVVDNGREIQFIQTDNGTVVSGKAQRRSSACDSSAFSGPYTYAIRGWVVAGGTYQPFADAGRIVADGNGALNGKSTYSASGAIGRRTFSGSYSIDSNCSGTAILRDNLGNVATLPITVVDGGQEVLFIQSESGTTISGRAHRGQFACATSVLSGPYSYSIAGYVVSSNGIIMPAADSGMLTADGNGSFRGADTISQGGIVNSRTVSGSYSINADCTGNAIFTDTLGNRLGLDVFVADGSNQVEFIQTDTGAVISGEAQRHGGNCSNATVSGAYGYAIEGWVASASITPFGDSGQLTADGTGHFSGSSTTSSGGIIHRRTLSGTYQTNSDCSGSASLRDNLGNGGNLRFTASGDGRQLNFIEIDSGTIVSGIAQRQLALPSDAIVSAASFAPGLAAPGSLFSIFGDGLASGVTGAGGFPLPTQLGGTSVSVDGKTIPVYYVSPSQINAQMPVETQPGSAQIVVTIGGRSSAPVTFTVPNAGPGVFTYGQSRAIAVNQDGSVNGPFAPTRSGDTIVVYLTGAGPVQPSSTWITGSPSPSGLSRVTLPFAVSIGGQPASVDYLGLTPGSIGLYQLNLRIPSLPQGDHTLVITVGGNASNSALISVSP